MSMKVYLRRKLMAANPLISEGCLKFVTHETIINNVNRTTTGSGGNTLFFYNTYIKPHLVDSHRMVIAIVSNNTAAGNLAKKALFMPLLTTSTNIQAVRGSASNFALIAVSQKHDFFMTAGSVIDVYVYSTTYDL